MDTDYNSFIHQINKTLLIRLFAASTLIAAIMGLGVTFFERNRISEGVYANAKEGAQRFVQQTGQLFANIDEDNLKTLQQKARQFVETRKNSRIGHFVEIRIFDPQSTMLVQISDNSHPGLENVQTRLNEIEYKSLADAPIQTQPKRINNQPYLFVSFPLFDINQKYLGYISAMFSPSATMIAEVNKRVARTVIAVIVVVLLTALLLYPIVRMLLKRVLKLSSALLDANLEIITVLGSAIAKRDSDTDLHNFRVTIYAVKVAEHMGLPVENIQKLIKGSFLHDVGKIGIRDNILLKPGKLNDDEFTIMKTHVEHGVDIASRAEWLKDAVDVIHNHHEKFDGSGYPKGLSGSDIPVNARIFTVVDVFDALTCQRPYKAAFTLTESMQILEQGRKKHFDPTVLDTFTELAPSLHQEFANCKDHHPRKILQGLTSKYFFGDTSILNS